MTGVQTCALPICNGDHRDLHNAQHSFPTRRSSELVWVQEEPANQGPWPFMALNLPAHLGGRGLSCISRPASASPAAGSHKKHDLEQHGLVELAFTLPG